MNFLLNIYSLTISSLSLNTMWSIIMNDTIPEYWEGYIPLSCSDSKSNSKIVVMQKKMILNALCLTLLMFL